MSHFDSVAEVYDETIPDHVIRHYLARRADLLGGLAGGGPVLDVGAGTGRLATLLAPSRRVVASDLSGGMIRKAPDSLTRLQCSASAIPFRDGAFALVYTVAALHHIAGAGPIGPAIREMWRVTAPGGSLVLWDHNPLNPYWPLLMSRVPQDDEPTRLVPLAELREELRRCGAERIAHRRMGWIPDFCPPFALRAASTVEGWIERLPVARAFSAHNVVIATK